MTPPATVHYRLRIDYAIGKLAGRYLVSRCGVRLRDTYENRQAITATYKRVTCGACKPITDREVKE